MILLFFLNKFSMKVGTTVKINIKYLISDGLKRAEALCVTLFERLILESDCFSIE